MRSVSADVEKILQAACKVVDLKRKDVEIGVFVVSPDRMRELNMQHRKKDKATDVLSFPLLTQKEVSTLRKKHGILHLGDIFINKVDAKKRLVFLVAHGFLHLLGYDHERSPKDEKIMFTLQDEITTSLGN